MYASPGLRRTSSIWLEGTLRIPTSHISLSHTCSSDETVQTQPARRTSQSPSSSAGPYPMQGPRQQHSSPSRQLTRILSSSTSYSKRDEDTHARQAQQFTHSTQVTPLTCPSSHRTVDLVSRSQMRAPPSGRPAATKRPEGSKREMDAPEWREVWTAVGYVMLNGSAESQ